MLHAKWRYRLATSSLRSRLLLIVGFGLLLLALTAALTTGWLSSRRASALMEAQSMKLTASFAEQSVLGLLYESPENVAEPLKSVLAFPGVTAAAVLRRDGQVLAGSAAADVRLPADAEPDGPVLVQETGESWTFSAPVYGGGQAPELGEELALHGPARELLGHVLLTQSKASLKAMAQGVLLTNVGVSLLFALAFLMALNLVIRHTTRPLFALSMLMRRAGKQLRDVQVDTRGPREIKRLAKAFNRMMADLGERDRRLHAHRDELESTVALRTAELVQARDDALSASRQKSEFLANMSHELRTPLQAIIGYSDIVRERLHLEAMDQETADMDTVIGNAQHLLGLINNVLDLAKLEAGRAGVSRQAVDILGLVHEAADTVRPLAGRNGNTLTIDATALTEAKLITDRQKILQVLLNLLSNAAKFTQQGRITLSVASTGQRLRLAVRDTGIGIPRDQLEAIFDEFHQVDGSATRAFQGSGLGLTLSRRFVLLLGGRISVESVLGQGSVFRVELPLAGPDPERASP